MKKAECIICVDSYIVRKGISSILRNIGGVDILKETENIDVLKNTLKEHTPDLIILSQTIYAKLEADWRNMLELNDRIILIRPDEAASDDVMVRSSLSVKTTREKIISEFEQLIHPLLQKEDGPADERLSERERTILKYITTGFTNREIAEKLFISQHTVTTHRKNIGNKLGIKSVSGLTVYAIVNNIISLEDIQE